MMSRWQPPQMWKGGECWIIGGGMSIPRQFGVPEEIIREVIAGKVPQTAYSSYLAPIHSKHIIGVNNAYALGEWVDVVFFGDNSWYLVHRSLLAKFRGLKVTCNPRFGNNISGQKEGVKYVPKDPQHKFGISDVAGHVSWNGNSGSAAINLAVHFGVRRIILLGFDMCLDKGGVSHWHTKKKKAPPFKRHLKGFLAIADDAMRMGIEIINASPESAIQVFPKISAKELLDESGNTQ